MSNKYNDAGARILQLLLTSGIRVSSVKQMDWYHKAYRYEDEADMVEYRITLSSIPYPAVNDNGEIIDDCCSHGIENCIFSVFIDNGIHQQLGFQSEDIDKYKHAPMQLIHYLAVKVAVDLKKRYAPISELIDEYAINDMVRDFIECDTFVRFLEANKIVISNNNLAHLSHICYRIYKDYKGMQLMENLLIGISNSDEYDRYSHYSIAELISLVVKEVSWMQ